MQCHIPSTPTHTMMQECLEIQPWRSVYNAAIPNGERNVVVTVGGGIDIVGCHPLLE